MRFLYLDDSGSTKDPNQEHVVIGGICVHESSVRCLSNKLQELAKEYDEENPNSVEFHAVDMFAGRGHPWNKVDNKQDRIIAIKKVLHTLDRNSSANAFAIAVHKASYPKADPILLAYEQLSQIFNNHLEYDCDPQENGIIILDNTSYKSNLQNLASEIRSTGNRKGLQNRYIIEIPLFVDSKVSRLVQLADHIAYSVFRRYNAADLSYFNEIENRFIFTKGVMRSLLHYNGQRDCTCPACVTRKK